MATSLSFLPPYSTKIQASVRKTRRISSSEPKFLIYRTHFPSILPLSSVSVKKRAHILLCSNIPTVSSDTTHYEFNDDSSEVELRLDLGVESISPSEIFVDGSENSLLIKLQQSGYTRTLLDTNSLYGTIKPSETIWYIDDDQLVVNLKKQDPALKWSDIMESWESLSVGVMQLLKGTSVFLVGSSTEINNKIARELAVGLGQARAVVATLGGEHGAARRPNKWHHLFAGFTVWLSESEATDEESAKEEAKKHIQDGLYGYSNAEVVEKLGGWDPTYSKSVAQASLSALKRLILSDKNLPGKKSLYIRLGCRGDWPDIKPPASDPSTGSDVSL